MPPTSSFPSAIRALVLSALFGVILFSNTLATLRARGDELLDRQTRRFWEDQALATGFYLTGELPVSWDAVERWRTSEGLTYYREKGGVLTRAVRKFGLSVGEFWETLPPRSLISLPDPQPSLRFDDIGRPLLLGSAYRYLGGVAPFLFFWLGALASLPLVFWLSYELDASGRRGAAGLSAVALAFSAFVVDVLALTYSSAGFYALGIIALMAFSAAVTFRDPTAPTLLARAALAGTALGLATICRSGTALLTPGFVLALALWARRRGAKRGIPVFFVSTIALICPMAMVREHVNDLARRTFVTRGMTAPPQIHAIWFGVWTGLGDHGAAKGYSWDDAAASRFVAERGGKALRPGFYDQANEAILREAVLRDILDDPRWYLSIVVRRAVSTLSQWTVLPWTPWSGSSTRTAPGTVEAAYLQLTGHIDQVRVGSRTFEVPFLLPLLATIALAFVDGKKAVMFVCIALTGALTLPVLITTAGAIEPMALGLIYIVGACLMVDVARAPRSENRYPGSRKV